MAGVSPRLGRGRYTSSWIRSPLSCGRMKNTRKITAEVRVMDIYVRLKAIGKRKDILAPTRHEIPDKI